MSAGCMTAGWLQFSANPPAYLTDKLCQVADVEARQRLYSSSSSSLIVSRTQLPTVGDELSLSLLHVSGTVCSILSLPHLP